ncbi:hypothetical protein DVH24_025496 [Malus domestica]|uniref:Uncharacterized protein n=1 Tax=Malus domestica TaxID=3750 RepID=A0A498HQX5_MALDO|nr:hypothetical protein DVH24_025496 [Malus domestica]
MGDPLGSSRVSSQKQNREGVVGAQSGQYRVIAESSLGCGAGPGQDGVDPVSLICIFSSLSSTRHFGNSLTSSSIGTPKLSEFAQEQSQDRGPTEKFSYEFLEIKP